MEVEELLKDFEETAIQQFEAQEKGDNKKSDKLLTKIKKLSKDLYNKNEIASLRMLLTHEHINVRFNAACKLLPFFTKEAESVLEEVEKAKNLTGFTAKMTLQEWRKGNIKFNY